MTVGDIMGALITAKCEKCDYKRDLFVGGGMMDWNWKSFIQLLPKDKQAEMRLDMENGGTNAAVIRKPCICTRCGNIYASAVVSYKLGKRKKQLTDNCPDCGSSQKTFLPEDGSYKLSCPDCGGDIEYKQTGFWD